MSIKGSNKTIQEDGEQKDAFTVTFTNGAREQLLALTDHFEADGELDLVRNAIGFLQKLKEMDEEKEKQNNE